MYSCKVVLGGSGGVEALRCINVELFLEGVEE